MLLRQGFGVQSLTSVMGPEAALLERNEFWFQPGSSTDMSYLCFSSAWCNSCSLAGVKRFVREHNWPWNVLWAGRTNSHTLENLFIASCCLLLNLNLIPFKFLFSKRLNQIHVEQREIAIKELGWWVLACQEGYRGGGSPVSEDVHKALALVGSPVDPVLLLLWETGCVGTSLPFVSWKGDIRSGAEWKA